MKLNPQTQKDNIFISNKKKKLNVELKSGPSLKTVDTQNEDMIMVIISLLSTTIQVTI